jgi:hypothetical protein
MIGYFETHYLQERTRQPSGFPFPNDFIYVFGDGMIVEGRFVQSQSDEMMIASAQGIKTRGKFVVSPAMPIHDGDVVRRERDGVFLRIIGDAVQSPEQAESQIKSFTAEITDRSDVR